MILASPAGMIRPRSHSFQFETIIPAINHEEGVPREVLSEDTVTVSGQKEISCSEEMDKGQLVIGSSVVGRSKHFIY